MKRLIVCMMVCLTSLQCMKHRVMHPDGVFSFEADERVFAANAFMNAAGFDGEWREEGMHPIRREVREYVADRLSPELQSKMRAFYIEHGSGRWAPYGAYALLLSDPPELRVDYDPQKSDTYAVDLEGEFSGFSPLLRAFYQEAHMSELWEKYRPHIQRENDRYIPHARRAMDDIIAYCRVEQAFFFQKGGKIHFTVCPLMSYFTANTLRVNDEVFIINGPCDAEPSAEAFYHEALDHIINPLTEKHWDDVERLHDLYPLSQERLKGNYPSWEMVVNESFVRTIDCLLSGRLHDRTEEETLKRVEDEYALGFMLCLYLYEHLPAYEESRRSLAAYYPELIGGIDIDREVERWRGFWRSREGEAK